MAIKDTSKAPTNPKGGTAGGRTPAPWPFSPPSWGGRPPIQDTSKAPGAHGGGGVVTGTAGPPGAGGSGTTPAPGNTPGVPTPPLEPFLTPDQMNALSEATKTYNLQVGDLDYNLGTQTIDTGYQKGQLDRTAAQATSDENDNAISRGIFQSSIRDGDLADISATNATAKGRLDDLLTAAQIHTDTAKRALKGALDDMHQNYNVLAANNAADAGKDQNPWITPPEKDVNKTPVITDVSKAPTTTPPAPPGPTITDISKLPPVPAVANTSKGPTIGSAAANAYGAKVAAAPKYAVRPWTPSAAATRGI